MVVFWKEDSGRQPQRITPENEGGDETSVGEKELEPQQRSRSRERAPAHVPPYAVEKSATVEPQGREGKKTMAEDQKPSDLPEANKQKPMDSDVDDE